MKTVTVNIPAHNPAAYDIRIGGGLLARLGEMLRAVAPAPTCAMVTDSNVGPHYLAPATAALEQAGYRVVTHVIEAGEQHKTLATVSAALDTILGARVERATPVVALGGGVVGDLAGYVAASLLRGVPFVLAPTTLLAAVDASVGGKVGVDHKAGKNLIGAFHQPRLVVTDIDTFRTLPAREIRCGLAECIKHAVIRDAGLFDFIRQNAGVLGTCAKAGWGETMGDLVARNVAIKAAVVEEDPFEHGVRALLNFGHTFGHAIENVMEYAGIQHGEAVALGMVAAGRMAVRLGRFGTEDCGRMAALIQAVGLPTRLPGLDSDKIFAAMFTDKKVRGGKLRFVLPTRIGQAEVVEGVAEGAVREAIGELGNS